MAAAASGASPGAAARSGRPDSSAVLLQARDRTNIVVECAALLQRIEQLDEDISQYDEWQRYPDADYSTRVRLRFEEARRREAAEKSGQIDASWSCHRASHTGSRSVIATTSEQVTSDKEKPAAASIELKRALRAAEFEAEVWRQRALDMEDSSEQEKAQLQALRDFELSSALREIEDTHTRLSVAQVKLTGLNEELEATRDQAMLFQGSFGKLRKDYQELEADHASCLKELHEAKASERALSAARAQSQALQSSLDKLKEAHQALSDKHDARGNELAEAAVREQSVSTKATVREEELANARQQLQHLESRDRSNRSVLESLQADLHNALADHADERTKSVKLEHLMEEAQAEFSTRLQGLLGAQKRSEFLHAKCTNLEIALEASSEKQAELSLEKHVLQEKTDRLEQLLVSQCPAIGMHGDKNSSVEIKGKGDWPVRKGSGVRQALEFHKAPHRINGETTCKPGFQEVSLSAASTTLNSPSSSTHSIPCIQVQPPASGHEKPSPKTRGFRVNAGNSVAP